MRRQLDFVIQFLWKMILVFCWVFIYLILLVGAASAFLILVMQYPELAEYFWPSWEIVFAVAKALKWMAIGFVFFACVKLVVITYDYLKGGKQTWRQQKQLQQS